MFNLYKTNVVGLLPILEIMYFNVEDGKSYRDGLESLTNDNGALNFVFGKKDPNAAAYCEIIEEDDSIILSVEPKDKDEKYFFDLGALVSLTSRSKEHHLRLEEIISNANEHDALRFNQTSGNINKEDAYYEVFSMLYHRIEKGGIIIAQKAA